MGSVMDERLVAWARAVKARQAKIYGRHALPVLWLFTDAVRLADPSGAVARLPRGLCGVVLRHDGHADRAALGRRLARLCRARRNALVVAGDWRLAAALHAGVHLRGGRKLPGLRHGMLRHTLCTSSAHGVAELVAARRGGAVLAFLSPAFATASHPGAAGLGPVRWRAQAGRAGIAVAALGGIAGGNVRRLDDRAGVAVGAIGALG
jgi:thiamine-phosphate pyrophosphorylase